MMKYDKEHNLAGKHHHHHSKRSPSEWASRLDSRDRDDWQDPQFVIQKMNINPGMTVADIGAGTGYLLSYLSEAVGMQGTVFAVDVESELIAYIYERIQKEKLTNVKTHLAEYDDLHMNRASVDRIVIINAWHHIDDRVAYAEKLHAILKSKGSLVIVDFKKDSEHGPPPESKLTCEQVVSEIEKSGYTVTSDTQGLSQQYIVTGMKE